MALKKIGALWTKSDKHGKDYLAGQLNLGVLGKVQITVFQSTEKQNEQCPDGRVDIIWFLHIAVNIKLTM